MDLETLRPLLEQEHANDQSQLDFIYSSDSKIIVTAPAGCGKTKTMISKIACEVSTTPTLNHSKILALTFSVNAASKIREDVKEKLPQLLNDVDFSVDNVLDVSNYHGFATRLIRKHGYVLHPNLKNLDSFLRVPESSSELNNYLTQLEINKLIQFDTMIKDFPISGRFPDRKDYLNILNNSLIPNNIVTYNGLILLAEALLTKDCIKRFYNKYYHMIIIDEAQDTNILAWQLIKPLLGSNKVVLLGDDIQKIYGFLGAVPNLFDELTHSYSMTRMQFSTNYRFKGNPEMLNLDSYLRKIFNEYDGIATPDGFANNANLKFFKSDSEDLESQFVCDNALKLTADGSKVAILVRMKYSADFIKSKFDSAGVKYFNGLFDDTNPEYIKFHQKAHELFIQESGISHSVRKAIKSKVCAALRTISHSITTDIVTFNSLMRLLDVLFDSVLSKRITSDEKYEQISYTLNNNALKRLMNEIDEPITITTIHGSKGLEWEYVFIPQLTAGVFPSWRGVCQECSNRKYGEKGLTYCTFKFPYEHKSPFLEELSIFYVAVTRAKKDVFCSGNTAVNQHGFSKQISCFAYLPGLNLIED